MYSTAIAKMDNIIIEYFGEYLPEKSRDDNNNSYRATKRTFQS